MIPKQVKSKIIINDPVHEVMDFGSDNTFRKLLRAVIDTVSFQRLRRISQLGLASFVFPGATHTRFSHSLGAAYLAYKVSSHLIEQGEEKTPIQIKEDQLSIIASALLHDIGHGPFSHSFENVLKDLLKESQILIEIPMHEDWTAEIIRNRKSDICRAISDNTLDPDLVASPFLKKTKKKFPIFLKQIVSSQIDVDRMDYLIRDSHFAGVSLGKIDLFYLINCLHVINHGKKGPQTLGIISKGIKPYEAYVVARQLMNRSIYYHKKVKVIENMVETIFRSLLKDYVIFNRDKKLSPLLPTYFGYLNEAIAAKKVPNKSDFLENGLAHYLNLTEDNFWVLAKTFASGDYGEISDLSKMLLKRQIPEGILLKQGKGKIAEEILESAKLKKNDDFIIVEMKTTMYQDISEDDKVFVFGARGEINDVSTHSQMISAFKDKPEFEKLLIIKNQKKTKKIKKILSNPDANII